LNDDAFATAAVRECFEEAGVWLGDGVPSDTLRHALNHREGSLLDEPSLVADLERLTLYSRWVTPVGEPKRYDTLFFLTQLRADENFIPQADQSETVDSAWFSPQEAVDAHQRGDVFLAPPTLLTLMELARFSSFEEIFSTHRDLRAIMPVHRREPDLEILLPGHPDHPEEERGFVCDRLRLCDGVWVLDSTKSEL
jgi:8-oxo-dGTP pyrophosphatase MutT (NUDIX family)